MSAPERPPEAGEDGSTPSRERLPVTGPQMAFHQVWPDAPMPVPARAVLRDLLPAKAVRWCTPVTAASSFGWVLFAPAAFAVRWMEDRLEFTLVDADGALGPWQVLGAGRPGQHPGTQAALAAVPAHRSAELADCLDEEGVPLVDPNPADPRELQVVSGVLARTAPGWATLVRPVPNLPLTPTSHDVVEGIVETAWYGNTLPVMVRLRTPGEVVRFSPRSPLAVVQPVALASLAPEHTRATEGGHGLAHWPDEEWERFVATRRTRLDALPASYRRAQHAYHHPPDASRE